MKSDYRMPVNIGSNEMISINSLVSLVASFENKNININHIKGPLGVRGRNSNNDLFTQVLDWDYKVSLDDGLRTTYFWILNQLQNGNSDA